ncbi:GNAT family N-acetyltransferase [Nocardioidaceae bacterium]|nr:GNAT family N-acetyltransferase [Nocardioidaceae bacterium]
MSLPGLRAAVPADATALGALESATMGREAWTADQVAEELAPATGRVVLLLPDDDRSVAWVDLAVNGEVADLLRLAVHPDRRRRGIGASVLGVGIAALPATVERVLLEVSAANAAAEATYAAAGFVPIARRAGYYRDGADALVMQLTLHEANVAGGTR